MSAAAVEAPVMAIEVDDFQALEERIRRMVELLKGERELRQLAEQHAAEMEQLARGRGEEMERLTGEMAALRRERDGVRQRVERLLKQLDEITQ